MTETLSKKTQQTLREYAHTPRHDLGQNFLIDSHVLSKILELADVSSASVVEEVGPGLGTLTYELCQRARAVCAIEADKTLATHLQNRLACSNLVVIEADALKVSAHTIEAALEHIGVHALPSHFVANLPYQIAATIVMQMFLEQKNIQYACVMVQKEVAGRMQAVPGTKQYGAYTAKLGLVAQVTGSFLVSPHSFHPQPHVMSAVVALKRHDTYSAQDVQKLANFIGLAFAQRRKTLVNALQAAGYEKEITGAALDKLALPHDVRAERLTTQDFCQLYEAIEQQSVTPICRKGYV